MTLNVDLTKLATAARRGIQYIDNCTVLDIGSGSMPREIEVRVPGDDGARLVVVNNVFPGLTTSDTVLISIDNSNQVARVEGFGTDTGTATVQLTEAPVFIAKNTSGATANANDVGYIDSSGEYKTTTTALDEVAWCVVVQGAANNSDIYVARQGRVTVAYTGTAPSAGDYLVTSTTAGSAQQQTTIRKEIFAQCLAAGSGGTVQSLLLTKRIEQEIFFDDNFLRNNTGDDSDFVSTVSSISTDQLTFGTVTAGSAEAIKPVIPAVSKVVLHNTTRTEEAYISQVDVGTSVITVTDSADISSWVATDAITARSQTNTSTIVSGVYWFDVDIDEGGYTIPDNAVAMTFAIQQWIDTGGAGEQLTIHPYKANVQSERQRFQNVDTAASPGTNFTVPIIARRFCISHTASGSTTCSFILRARRVTLAVP